MKNRRDFIKLLSIGASASFASLSHYPKIFSEERESILRFSICADVHKDIMHDADSRLEAFIKDASQKDLNFILQLGDFCIPNEKNEEFLSIWNRYRGQKYHVLGNHDMDGGYTKEQTLKFWNAEAPYYSFDAKAYHFVILDGNDEDKSTSRPPGYARYIGEEQLKWLERDLDRTNLPTIVFCHQGLDNDLGGIHNATVSRLVFESANQKSGFQKVRFVFSGHHHQDYHNEINGIHYIQINSMSYQWLGDDYKYIRYGAEVDKSHPLIKLTVPYKDPLWAYVEISDDGTLNLFGKKSSFVGPSPKELNVDMNNYGYPIVPHISDKKIKI